MQPDAEITYGRDPNSHRRSVWQRLAGMNPLLKLALGAGIVMILLVIGYRFGGAGISNQATGGSISVSDAEASLRAGGAVYFTVSYGTQAYLEKVGLWQDAEAKLRYSQPFVFSANTHVGTIRDMSLEGKIFLLAGGVRYPAVGQPIASTTHHNTFLIFLPRFDMAGEPIFESARGSFDILIEGVDVPAERVFTFNYPLPITGGRRLGLTRILMLAGAAMAAMLLTCTPCLVGSLTVGSLTMGTAWGPEAEAAAKQVRAEMVKKTLYYLAALVVAYAAVAVAASAFDVSIEDIRPVEVMGGVLLVIVGLSLLRSWRPVIWLERAVVRMMLKIIPGSARFVTPIEPEPGFSSRSSSAMGASLAMVCSVAGAPTLTTAIILPVMIYAGFNNIYWSLAILLVFLLVTAVPFFLIAVGLGEFLITLSTTWRRRLMVANAFLLIGLGAMLLLSPEAVAGVLSAPARLIIEPLSWLF